MSRILLGFIFFIISLIASVTFAQPAIEWDRTFEHADEWLLDVKGAIATTDGGVLVIGSVFDGELWGDADMFALKLNRNFEVEWYNQYGDYVDEEEALWVQEVCNDVVQTSDGGYLLAGQLYFYESEEHFYIVPYLIKIDTEGEFEWERYHLRYIDEEYRGISEFYEIVEIDNGDFFIQAGIRHLLRVNNEGDSLSLINLDADDLSIGIRDMNPAMGNGFILSGSILLGGSSDFYFMEIDQDGCEIWSNHFGNNDNHHVYEEAWKIIPSNRGGYVSLGQPDYFDDLILIALDENGNRQWQRSFEIPGGCLPSDLKPTNDGGFIFSTISIENLIRYYYIIRTDVNGRELWTLISEEGYRNLYHPFLIPLSDRSYLLVLSINDDIHYIKTEPDPVHVDKPDVNAKSNEFTLFPAYPNPFNTQARFVYSLPYSTPYSLYLYDHAGRYVKSMSSGYGVAGVHYGWVDAGSLPSGSYYIRLLTPDGSVTSPIVITK